ncbi:MAG: transporter, partial [Roseibacillus sp.]|nr:transporter [Roseibacillus sp.]
QIRKERAHLGLGILLPTAEVDRQGVIPGPGTTRLPYPMQLGAGSWGIVPSLTYLGQGRDWSWGGQLSARIYLADNDEGYRHGNRWEATVWGARRLNKWISLSARATGSTWGNIRGSDADLLPLPVPTADPKRRGGSRLDGSVGVNLQIPGTRARMALEVGAPLWQDLDGPQLGSEWWTILGAQFAF